MNLENEQLSGGYLEASDNILRSLLELQQFIKSRLLGVDFTEQAWLSPAQFAERVARKPATVRSWCRSRRINARKRMHGRGGKQEWELSTEELKRFREHGLLPEANDDR